MAVPGRSAVNNNEHIIINNKELIKFYILTVTIKYNRHL